MAKPILTNEAVSMPQEERLGATPAPLPVASVQPGAGIPSSPAPTTTAAPAAAPAAAPKPAAATPAPKPAAGQPLITMAASAPGSPAAAPAPAPPPAQAAAAPPAQAQVKPAAASPATPQAPAATPSPTTAPASSDPWKQPAPFGRAASGRPLTEAESNTFFYSRAMSRDPRLRPWVDQNLREGMPASQVDMRYIPSEDVIDPETGEALGSVNRWAPRIVNGERVMYRLSDAEMVSRAKSKKNVGTGGGLVSGWQNRRDDDPIKRAWIAAGSPKEGQAYFDFVEVVREMQKDPAVRAYEERVDRENLSHITSMRNDPRVGTIYGVDPALIAEAQNGQAKMQPLITNTMAPPSGELPMPKPPIGAGGATPMPKQPGVPGSEVPMPKPRIGGSPAPSQPGSPLIGGSPMPKPPVGGPGTAPAPPAVTPGGGSPGGSSFGSGDGTIDWRSAISASDREAVTREVGENELTSRQLARLIDEKGRYIQSARLGARETASESGMLLSSIAAGAGERAAIDAAAPIAQADASVFANTASENMQARNADAQADQSASRSLISQSEGQRFQGAESAKERDWRSMEAGKDRDMQFLIQERGFSFQAAQAEVERGWRSTEAERDRAQQTALQRDQQRFQSEEAGTERDWRSREAVSEREFSGSQNELQRQQQRISEYNSMMIERERGFQNQLAAIFSNSNLTPEQQQRAAENARAIFSSTTASFNAAFAQGIPQIFMRPYEMTQPAPGSQPVQPPGASAPLIGGAWEPIPGTTLERGPGGAIRVISSAAVGRR